MNIKELLKTIESHGGCVRTRKFNDNKDAGFDLETNTIWMDISVPEGTPQYLCTLAHEFIHMMRGDDGPQPDDVEALRDEEASCLLISPVEYALAESMYGTVEEIAEELGVTVEIVEAYRRSLAKTKPIRL